MKIRKPVRPGTEEMLHREAIAFGDSIDAIRTAQGKRNPGEVPVRSPEWYALAREVVRDAMRLIFMEMEENEERGPRPQDYEREDEETLDDTRSPGSNPPDNNFTQGAADPDAGMGAADTV